MHQLCEGYLSNGLRLCQREFHKCSSYLNLWNLFDLKRKWQNNLSLRALYHKLHISKLLNVYLYCQNKLNIKLEQRNLDNNLAFFFMIFLDAKLLAKQDRRLLSYLKFSKRPIQLPPERDFKSFVLRIDLKMLLEIS